VCECEQIRRDNGLWYSTEYSTFSVSDEAGNYRLTVAGYSGDAGDALAGSPDVLHRADGMMFSTPDQDHDTHSTGHCALMWNNGWWYAGCTLSVINWDRDYDDGQWQESPPPVKDVKTSRMMLKIV